MNRLLITGVDSVAGSNIALTLADRWQVLGLYRADAVELADVETAACPAHKPHELHKLVADFRPRWIVCCPGVCSASWDEARCESDDLATVGELVQAARDVEARLTVLSTDAVFSGPRMFHEESSPALAKSQQAERARQIEHLLDSSSALVVRTHAYGWSPLAVHAGFAQQVWQTLSAGGAVTADGRRHASPILASDLAERLARAYECKLEGLYHVSGAERTSPYRFARELAVACGLEFRVQPVECGDADSQCDGWEGETSMNSRRARRALETSMPLLREGLGRFAQQAEDGYRDRLGSGRTHRGGLLRAA